MKNKTIAFILSVAIVLGLISLILILISVRFSQVVGDSMSPTVNDGDKILCMKFLPLKEKDIVLYKVSSGYTYIGRINIVGPYKSDSISLAANTFYILGDNLDHSSDSRDPKIGAISKENIQCVVLFK
jgi:signal peptidase I